MKSKQTRVFQNVHTVTVMLFGKENQANTPTYLEDLHRLVSSCQLF